MGLPFNPTHSRPAGPGFSPAAAAIAAQTAKQPVADRTAGLLTEARSRIQGQMTPAQIDDPSTEDLHTAENIIRPLVESALAQARANGETVTIEANTLVREMMDSIFGYGPLAPYLNDEAVEEIICNGPWDIWLIHAQQGKVKTTARFRDGQELRHFVNRIAGAREINRAKPKLDAQMRDGSRLHAIMEPLVANIPIAVTIRRHRLVARTLDDLERLGTITPAAKAFLELAVQARLNLVIAGGTASGKTNFLNALANAASEGDRFVTVEDTPEIQITKPDVVQLTTRDQAEEAKAFTMADLVIEALRMRPDRIITGEARGPEIVDVLAAANTGHDGQMLTIHANSTRDIIQRMETMYLMKGIEVPTIAVRRQIADAFNLVLYLKRVLLGNVQRRFVTDIAEISPSQYMEGDRVIVQSIFEDKGHGMAWTGYFPERLAAVMKERNVPLMQSFFRR